MAGLLVVLLYHKSTELEYVARWEAIDNFGSRGAFI